MNNRHALSARRIGRPGIRGFTLIELMMGITVAALLLGLGIPTFTDMIRNNRTAAQANDLVGALSYARSEANRRGIPVSVCAAASDTTCAGAAADNWANGWLIFTDRIGTFGVIDAGDEILQRSRTVTGGLQLASGNIGFVRFSAAGRLPAAMTFSLQHEDCTDVNRRQIALDMTGRVNISKVACT